MDENTFMKVAGIEKQARELEENLQIIDGQLQDLEMFKYTLESFIKSSENEILSTLGSRVYVKAKVEDKEKLFVEVGAGVVVKKSPNDTLNITIEQIKRLTDVRMEILGRLQSHHEELQKFIDSIRKE
ncbi:MAG: prefoldin subunit alpha [Nanoarchaeota archaeon]|nr:prefoldin subunit alpha [Nanoarchaeota archaeon]